MISFSRYARLLADPPLRATIAASVLGRLPIGIAGLAVLLFAQGATGSFARAGAAAALYVIGLACLAPLLGRLIDRSGPRSVLLTCALAYPAALSAFVVAVQQGAGAAASLVLAAAAGAFFPPITVCMRSFFRRQLADDALLAAAFSLESVLIELIFILGPLLVALLVAFASAAAAVLFAAGCGFAGTLLFLRTPALGAWRIEARPQASLFGPLAARGFVALLAIVLAYATAFGFVEVGVTAYAAEVGHLALAGVLLGLMSLGSAAGGLAYGGRTWGAPLARQFAVVLLAMGGAIAPLALARSEWLFAPLGVLAGVAMAPALIIQAMLVAKTAAPGHSTEAFTWATTALLTGVGLGTAAGGSLVERWGSPSTFVAAALAAILAGTLASGLETRAPATG
jgi:predicted MFS family arabinose efflux permease